MKTSESINNIIEALCKAQASFSAPVKNKINPHFKSKYADLANVFEAVRLPLAENGLAFTQTTARIDGLPFLVTTLFHKSGEWIQTEMQMPGFTKAQELGSSLSYCRRYSIMGLLGLAPDDDDDGNLANRRNFDTPIAKLTKEQAETICNLTKEDANYLNQILAHYKVEQVQNIPSKDYDLIVSRIKAKYATQA